MIRAEITVKKRDMKETERDREKQIREREGGSERKIKGKRKKYRTTINE